MSTPPNPAVTVNSPAPEIAQANQVSQQTPTPGQPPAAPSPATVAPAAEYTLSNLDGGKLKVTYATGEVFEGTPQEVIDKTAKAHVQTKQWAKNQVSQAQQAPPPQQPPPPQSPFSDPQEQAVAEYTANLIAKTLGYEDSTRMRQALGMIEQNSMDYGSQTVALKFQAAQPDFNPTSDNSDKLLKTIDEAGMADAFNSAAPEQQVKMMQQAHAYCLMTKTYEAKPTQGSPTVPNPPPPAPTGRDPVPTGGLPPELQAQITDTPQQIMEKWNKARAMGLA